MADIDRIAEPWGTRTPYAAPTTTASRPAGPVADAVPPTRGLLTARASEVLR